MQPTGARVRILLRHDRHHGLTLEEGLREYGPNRLPEQPPSALWQIVLRQFYSPLIYILVIAAVVSVFIGDLKDAAFIAAVLVINAIIGSYQEWKAEQNSHALWKLLQIRAAVQRDGEVRDIPAEQVVPGDVVWLESGNRVPADPPSATCSCHPQLDQGTAVFRRKAIGGRPLRIAGFPALQSGSRLVQMNSCSRWAIL